MDSLGFGNRKKKELYDIIILKSNSIIYDSRIKKIAKSLSKKYSLLVCGWNREGLIEETVSNYPFNIELFNLRSPIGKFSLIGYYPFFWIWIFYKLIRYRPKIVHACDLDTIPPVFLYKLIFKKKMIFDIFDRFAMGYIPKKFTLLYNIVDWFEEYASNFADVVITVNEDLLNTLKKKPKRHVIIMNCPEDHTIIKKNRIDNTFTLVYTGAIREGRGLLSISKAIKELHNINLSIAGKSINKPISDELLENPKISYIGTLLPEESINLEANSDVMIALYDPSNPQNAFALPNKLFESMMCGIPIISNVASKIVTKYKCGIVVEYDNIDQIRQAIVTLRNEPQLRIQLGNNGRKAYNCTYNWILMEKKLFEVYNGLFKKLVD